MRFSPNCALLSFREFCCVVLFATSSALAEDYDSKDSNLGTVPGMIMCRDLMARMSAVRGFLPMLKFGRGDKETIGMTRKTVIDELMKQELNQSELAGLRFRLLVTREDAAALKKRFEGNSEQLRLSAPGDFTFWHEVGELRAAFGRKELNDLILIEAALDFSPDREADLELLLRLLSSDEIISAVPFKVPVNDLVWSVLYRKNEFVNL